MKKQLLVILSTLFVGAVFAESLDEGVTPPPPPKPDCNKIVYRKWNDLLFVDNGDNEYVSYQWYKDQQIMPGETKQYIYTEGTVLQGDGALYYVIATKRDGKEVMSCENLFEDFPSSQEYNPAQLRKAELYSSMGRKVGEWKARPAHMSGLTGMYVWRFTDSEGHTWTERVIY